MTDAPPPTDAPPVSSGRRLAGGLALALAGGVLATIFLTASDGGATASGIAWQPARALLASETPRARKPRLVYFTADWCPPCQYMKREVFTRRAIQERLGSAFIPVMVDLTDPDEEARALAARYNVQQMPTFVILGPSGEPIDRMTGGAKAEAFDAWLEQAETRLHEARAITPPGG